MGRTRVQREISARVSAGKRQRVLLALAALVVLKYIFHAFLIPAYDGPDEAFHLARVLAFSRASCVVAFRGGALPDDLVQAVANRPCGADLARVFQCEQFPVKGSLFNILSRAEPRAPKHLAAPGNYEDQQPPLYYALAGLLLRPFAPLTPDVALLLVRSLSVLFVALALFGPLRVIVRPYTPEMGCAFLIALLLPGAAEALARGSNDALLFLWVATMFFLLPRTRSNLVLCAGLAIGPMIKLTAFAVVAVLVVRLWRFGKRPAAAVGLAASFLVLPIQWLRGWLHGATYTYAAHGLGETWWQSCVGLMRTGWGLAKTAFWVGGWVAFRPPWELVAVTVMVVGVSLVVLRPFHFAKKPEHAVGLAVAAIGTVFIAIGNRRYAGTWGGLCGWYFWGWSPWIATYLYETRNPADVPYGPLATVGVLVVLLANVSWAMRAVLAYG